MTFAQTVLAYLDPGSGSAILQILLGGVAAVTVTARLWWDRALRLLRIRRDEPAAAATEPADGAAARQPATERQATPTR